MARIKLQIDKETFQRIVSELEANQSFDSPSKLWQAVAATEWGRSLQPRSLTAMIAYQRAKELGITYKTLKGKRGRPSKASV